MQGKETEMSEILDSVTRKLATAELGSKDLERVAKLVSIAGEKNLKVQLDVCKYGICLDMLVPGKITDLNPILEEFVVGEIAGVEFFPWGIVDPDLWQVRIGQRL